MAPDAGRDRRHHDRHQRHATVTPSLTLPTASTRSSSRRRSTASRASPRRCRRASVIDVQTSAPVLETSFSGTLTNDNAPYFYASNTLTNDAQPHVHGALHRRRRAAHQTPTAAATDIRPTPRSPKARTPRTSSRSTTSAMRARRVPTRSPSRSTASAPPRRPSRRRPTAHGRNIAAGGDDQPPSRARRARLHR